MARTAAKRSPARRTRKSPSTRQRSAAAEAPAVSRASASTGGVADLAGGMRAMLGQIDEEVRRVSALSQQIDDLVRELNTRRDEQAQRLLALDALRASVDDAGLTAFLDKAIRPRRVRVPEVIPERLTQ